MDAPVTTPPLTGSDPYVRVGPKASTPRHRHTVEQIITKLLSREVTLSKWPARWRQHQSHPSQRGLVLVVPEVCAGRHGVGRVREGSTRGQERLLGYPDSGAAVGVTEEERA
jgi:hypothetical protein